MSYILNFKYNYNIKSIIILNSRLKIDYTRTLLNLFLNIDVSHVIFCLLMLCQKTVTVPFRELFENDNIL